MTASSGCMRTQFAMHDASKARHEETNYARTRHHKTMLPRQIEHSELLLQRPRAALAHAKRRKVRPTLFTHGIPDASNKSQRFSLAEKVKDFHVQCWRQTMCFSGGKSRARARKAMEDRTNLVYACKARHPQTIVEDFHLRGKSTIFM